MYCRDMIVPFLYKQKIYIYLRFLLLFDSPVISESINKCTGTLYEYISPRCKSDGHGLKGLQHEIFWKCLFSSNSPSWPYKRLHRAIFNFQRFFVGLLVLKRLPSVRDTRESPIPFVPDAGESRITGVFDTRELQLAFLQENKQARIAGIQDTGESRIPGVWYTGESRIPGVRDTRVSPIPSVQDTGESFFYCSLFFSNFKPLLQPLK